MTLNVEKELAALGRMSVAELKQKYEEAFGEACRSNHRQWLVKRIIWRLQANAEGDLSERARRRALELANDADLRMKAPPTHVGKPAGRTVQGTIARSGDSRLPMPGTILTRQYKGETVQVTVLPDEKIQWEGEVYGSLSAAAKAITGTHTNGYLFFKLNGGRR